MLSASGVPVYATQGTGGGISVLEHYTVSRAMLTNSEKDSILFALQTLQATRYPEIEGVLEKLGSLFRQPPTDWIAVDFTPWGANPNAYAKFSDIKMAILKSWVIDIDYINARNEKSRREVEPLRLIFKSQAWYLWGYCLTKQGYRTFRISRIKRVSLTDRAFERNRTRPQKTAEPPKDNEKPFIHLILSFTQDALYRLYDDYDDTWIRRLEDGTYRLELDLPEDEWVYSYIMSFGPMVKVISPAHIRGVVRERYQRAVALYEEV